MLTILVFIGGDSISVEQERIWVRLQIDQREILFVERAEERKLIIKDALIRITRIKMSYQNRLHKEVHKWEERQESILFIIKTLIIEREISIAASALCRLYQYTKDITELSVIGW